MLKIVKFTGLLILFCILLYTASFAFSNSGLGPSYGSLGLGGEHSTPQDNPIVSFGLTDQDIPEVKAASYEVIDLNTDQVLLTKRADSSFPVASLTKLMTAWIVINYGDLTDKYEVTSADTKDISPSLGLSAGDTVIVKDLLNSMLIGSANDAAVTLSHYIEKKTSKQFIDLMNQEAQNLKLSNTRFSNPNGFDSDTNYSSANDLKILAENLLQKNVFENTSRAFSYSFSGTNGKVYHVQATNQLTKKYPDLYAIKTGYTNFALGSMINRLQVGDKSFLIIVIGSPDREADTLFLRGKITSQKLGNQ